MKIGFTIQYTLHAEDRILARGIDKVIIEKILNHPSAIVYDGYTERHKCYGPYEKSRGTNRYVKIVYSKRSNTILVITAMVTDKGGLKANGFSIV